MSLEKRATHWIANQSKKPIYSPRGYRTVEKEKTATPDRRKTTAAVSGSTTQEDLEKGIKTYS